MKKEPMTKDDAVLIVVREARLERKWTNAAVQRIVKACKTLGLTTREMYKVMSHLDIIRFQDGEPYHAAIKRTW